MNYYFLLFAHFFYTSITGDSYIFLISASNTFFATFLFNFNVGVNKSFSIVNGSLRRVICFGFSKLFNLFIEASYKRSLYIVIRKSSLSTIEFVSYTPFSSAHFFTAAGSSTKKPII